MKYINLLAVGHRAVAAFMDARKIRNPGDFRRCDAQKFADWRAEACFARHKYTKISASTIRHELGELKKIAGGCGRGDLLPHWGKARIKDEASRITEPLTIEEQKELLLAIKGNSALHDTALLLLVSGVRAGELKNARYRLNGKVPCPTLDRILERGHVFGISENAARTAFKRMSPPVSMSRLRHTFAANRLKACVPPEDVGDLLEHAKRSTVKELYGGHIPNGLLGTGEQATAHREWVRWLENGYFGTDATDGKKAGIEGRFGEFAKLMYWYRRKDPVLKLIPSADYKSELWLIWDESIKKPFDNTKRKDRMGYLCLIGRRNLRKLALCKYQIISQTNYFYKKDDFLIKKKEKCEFF